MADTTSLVRKVESRGGFIAQRLRMDIATNLTTSALAAGHHKTGALIDGTKVTQFRTSPTTWRILAENKTVQAATTNSGARPHLIEPRRARALRFSSGGSIVFARRVHHPGNRASHWFDRVMNHAFVAGLLREFVGR